MGISKQNPTCQNSRACTQCGVLKPIADFRVAKKGVMGFSAECRYCSRERDRAHRLGNSHNLIYKIGRSIFKRQKSGTHLCLLKDVDAYKAASHLLGDYGLMDAATSQKHRHIVALNLPSRLARIDARANQTSTERLARQQRRAQLTSARSAERVAERAAFRLSKKSNEDVTDIRVMDVLFERMRSHLKKRRRVLKSSDFSFTRQNFFELTGYSVLDLYEHLEGHIPHGFTWRNVIGGQLQIEHNIPAAAYDLRTLEGVRACYALSNLSLLPAHDNAAKGATSDRDTITHFRSDSLLAHAFGLFG